MTYSGYELLTLRPDWKDASWGRVTTRTKTRLDNRVSQWADDAGGPTGVGERGARLYFGSRSEVAAWRTFIATARGRATPFWMPTWMYDLELFQGQSSADVILKIKWCGYTRLYTSTSDFGRRHLAVVFPTGTIIARRVTSAVDNGDGTETLTVDAAWGATIPITAMVSFLTLCRFENDAVGIEWIDQQSAITEFGVRELPREAPTV